MEKRNTYSPSPTMQCPTILKRHLTTALPDWTNFGSEIQTKITILEKLTLDQKQTSKPVFRYILYLLYYMGYVLVSSQPRP